MEKSRLCAEDESVPSSTGRRTQSKAKTLVNSAHIHLTVDDVTEPPPKHAMADDETVPEHPFTS